MKTEEQETSRHDNDDEVIVKLSSIICPRTLDYDAPLLSTRRAHIITRSNLINPTSWADRVPFSWEQSPGKPKQRHHVDVAHDHDVLRGDQHIVPPPKLPPARWHDQMIIDQYDRDFDSASDEDIDAFSDTIDVFSLGESSRVCDIDENYDDDDDDEERTGMVINNCGSSSPNFILKRFLPDASALAMSSSLALQGSGNASFGRGKWDHEPKGCGIDFLLPWKSIKLKHCSLKSPVLEPVNRKQSSRRRMNK